MKSNKTLPKRKRIFENFLVFGVEKNDFLNEIEMFEFILTPKVLFSFPEAKMDQNIFNYFYSCCFPKGVKIRRMKICCQEEYDEILEKNFFDFPLTTFAFVKSSNDKFRDKFLYCMKFLDLYVFKAEKNFNVFIYEKIYVFVSNEILFHFLENLSLWFLKVKKINYLNSIASYENLEKNMSDFFFANDEKNNKEIKEILNYCVYNSFSKSVSFLTEKIFVPKSDENFLSWIFSKIIWFFDAEVFFGILVRVLLEQKVVFCGNDVELVSFSSLMFAHAISPFKWEFSLVPNLPLQHVDVLQSPSPFIAGLVLEKPQLKAIEGVVDKSSTNVVFVDKKKTFFVNKVGKLKETLFFLRAMVEKTFWEFEDIDYRNESKKYVKNKCEMFVNKIEESIYQSIINKLKPLDNGDIKEEIKKFVLNQNDAKFFAEFVDTVMFNNFINNN